MVFFRRKGVTLFSLIMGLVVTIPAYAFDITFVDAFDFPGSDGIVFHTGSGHLFVVAGSEVSQVTTSGDLVTSFNPGLNDVQGISHLPNGNLLLSDQNGAQSSIKELTTAGSMVPGGIDIEIGAVSVDGDGVAYHSTRGTIFVGDPLSESIYEFGSTGTLLHAIDTSQIVAGFDDPEGLTVDPLTGNLLVVDDAQGTSSLYELTAEGDLVMSVDLLALTGFSDPEGVALDPQSRKLFVAFDVQNKIGVFQINDPVSTDSPPVVPEPTTLLLFGTGVIGLAFLRKGMRNTKCRS